VTTQPLTSGFDPTDLSKTVRPQDDLYQYVNGGWIERTTMPEDKARYGTFDILADGAELAIRAILDESRAAPEGGEARKVGDLYSSFLDEERINARGVRPLIDRLAQVEALASINELLALIGRLQRRGVGGFYAIFVDNDPVTPSVTSRCWNRRPFAPRRELLPRRALRSDSRSLRGARGTNARIRWPE